MIARRLSPCAATMATLVALAVPEASASPEFATGDDAMPGVIRTDSAEAMPLGLSLRVSSSYGYTGQTLEADDTHHRGAGGLSVAYALTADLAVAIRLDGRYDKHFMEGGRDDGWVGDPRFLARYRHTLSPSLAVGVQMGLWAPGSEAPSIEFDAVSAELIASLTWTEPGSPLTVSANAGYRLDRSAGSVPDPDRLSLADRMSLGVSDFNAVLASVGASYEFGATEALAEWSFDLLQGSGAPGFRSSPMRVAAGARHRLSNGWYLFGQSEFRVSKVESADVAELLLPFDPRISVLAGLQVRFGGTEKGPLVSDEDRPGDQNPPDVTDPVDALPTTGPLRGTIASGEGPIAGAAVVFTAEDGSEHRATSGEDGTFVLDAVGIGAGTLKVTADGFEEGEASVTVTAEGAMSEVSLEPVLPPGQLRGQVRSYLGKGLSSKLTVQPGGHSIETDVEGSFELDLPPGDYEVTISVSGYKEQTRKIHIDENGVTIMNVDLRRRDRNQRSKR